jgi:hypothetical protein
MWTHDQIRAARKTPLKPVLERLGFALTQKQDDNYCVKNLAEDVIVKNHFWVRPHDGSSGNAIDFFVRLRGKSFNEAMELLLRS